MSSPWNSMHENSMHAATAAAHNAQTVIIDPHVATAIWAIVLAIACALVIIIAEMVKQRNGEPSEPKRRRRKTPPN